MKKIINALFKKIFILFTVSIFFMGAYLSFELFYKHIVFDSTRIQFENGFIYTTAPMGIRGGKVVLNPDGTVTVASNVRYVEDNGRFIYGMRKVKEYGDLAATFYFICEKDKDCNATQKLNENDFIQKLQSLGFQYNRDEILNPLLRKQMIEWLKVNIFGKPRIEMPRKK